YKKTPLLCVLENDHKDSVDVFLSTEVIDRVDKDNKSQLHYAVEYGHTKSVEALLSAGAKLDIVDKDNKTPLHYAAEKGNNKSVETLLSAGANVEVVDKDNKTPLHYAAEKGNNKSVEALLSKGAKVEVVDKLLLNFQYDVPSLQRSSPMVKVIAECSESTQGTMSAALTAN
uniref:Serine/threonine-protein phosphatase 6 regulatory ankyrin repeat subunit B-like n=1 Tax=Saccoglossus kowalevskii TaxID=10224 RepID=A0ABM0MPB7_SACKO